MGLHGYTGVTWGVVQLVQCLIVSFYIIFGMKGILASMKGILTSIGEALLQLTHAPTRPGRQTPPLFLWVSRVVRISCSVQVRMMNFYFKLTYVMNFYFKLSYVISRAVIILQIRHHAFTNLYIEVRNEPTSVFAPLVLHLPGKDVVFLL